MKNLKKEAPKAVHFYRPDVYMPDASIQENIIFGRITSDSSHVRTRINTYLNRLLVEKTLLEAVLEIGMNFEVGRGGENLSGGQRQKVKIFYGH
jgi:ABC-type bacteriocin/lantibiotic exporter with double-glycine peptidase domain